MRRPANSFTLENPAVRYRVIDCSPYVVELSRHKCSKYTLRENCMYNPKFLIDMLNEVECWERVQELPDTVIQWYTIQISIMGNYCKILCTVGRGALSQKCGYVVIHKIDDTDA